MGRFALLVFVYMTIGVFPCIASAGVLLVSGFDSDNVVRFDSTTGMFIDEFIPSGGGGLRQAEGIAFAPDGSLWVNSFGSNQILRYDGATGAFQNVVGSVSLPTGLLLHGGLAYVASYASNGFVDRFNLATGAFVDTFVTPGSGGLSNAHGLTFGPDGNLYVSDNGNARVSRYDGVTGAFLGVFASGGGLNLPTDLVFGPDGNLYVSSVGTNSVLRYNGITGAFMDSFISSGSGGLVDSHALYFRGDGSLLVSGGSVRQFDATTGAYLDLFASSPELVRPTYFAFATNTVPEPSSIIIMGFGFVALCGRAWRRRSFCVINKL